MLAVILAAGLIGGIMAAPADAQKRKKKQPKPVETTLFMHGESQFGEIDGLMWLNDGAGPDSPLTLDAEEPEGGTKSMNYFSPLLNDRCTGLPLAFPTFIGDLTGRIKGDATMTLHFMSAPASGVLARIWADVGAFTACNDEYIEPASEVEFEVPPGQNEVEVVFEDLDLPAQATIMIEVLVPSGPDYSGQVGRLLYDSADAPTSITFMCVPPKGKKACTP